MQLHSFHIPVMGIGYTIDSPVKVAHLGIASAISLVDDILVERMRAFYSEKYNMPFSGISNKIEDFRAKRITAYLDTVNSIVNQKTKEFKVLVSQKREVLNHFLDLLPDTSELKERIQRVVENSSPAHLYELLDKYLHPGSIDVNIMTKLDKENYLNGEKLPSEYNDAHAALRGFAQSSLNSSIVLSAGMNARLYTYMEQFQDFYPEADGSFRKRIILKVSDYRSAIVQGKIFAKKGLWVSEFRVESGLNCGGHAFATQGYLLGPILEEFSKNREALRDELFEVYKKGLEAKSKAIPVAAPEIRLTAQGGVGTNEEHKFLMQKYGLDSIGWGSPFLLVPEAVSVDKETIDLLAKGNEEDFYLSDISPVGVRFNNIRGNSRDREKLEKANAGKPGAPCTKQFILLNTEYPGRPICTGSRQYQKKKIEDLEGKGLSKEQYDKEYFKIIDKACICNGLGVATLKSHGMDTAMEGSGVSVCPGPNLAYFTKEASLKEMVDHIYGRTNLISHPNRPNLFVKELTMYLDYIENQFFETEQADAKQFKYWAEFLANLDAGIQYYQELFSEPSVWSIETKTKTLSLLKTLEIRRNTLIGIMESMKNQMVTVA
jgi:hypothetical protein